jgi:hypothetical protein
MTRTDITTLLTEISDSIVDVIDYESEEIIFRSDNTKAIKYVRNGIELKTGDPILTRGRDRCTLCQSSTLVKSIWTKRCSLTNLPIIVIRNFDI